MARVGGRGVCVAETWKLGALNQVFSHYGMRVAASPAENRLSALMGLPHQARSGQYGRIQRHPTLPLGGADITASPRTQHYHWMAQTSQTW